MRRPEFCEEQKPGYLGRGFSWNRARPKPGRVLTRGLSTVSPCPKIGRVRELMRLRIFRRLKTISARPGQTASIMFNPTVTMPSCRVSLPKRRQSESEDHGHDGTYVSRSNSPHSSTIMRSVKGHVKQRRGTHPGCLVCSGRT